MEHIIQQITVELVEKITEKAYSGGISDIDALASEVLQDCKQAAASIIETLCSAINLQIRKKKRTGACSQREGTTKRTTD